MRRALKESGFLKHFGAKSGPCLDMIGLIAAATLVAWATPASAFFWDDDVSHLVERVETTDGPICFLKRVADMDTQLRLAQERIAAGELASPQPYLSRAEVYDGTTSVSDGSSSTTTSESTEDGDVPIEASMTEEERIAAFECLMPQLYQGYLRSPHGLVHQFQQWALLTAVPFYSDGMGGRYVHVYANERVTLETERGRTLYVDRNLRVGSTLAAPSFSLRSDGMILPGPLMFVEKMNRGFTFGLGNWRYTKVAHNGFVESVTRGKDSDKIDICVECTETPADHLYMALLNDGIGPPIEEKAPKPTSADEDVEGLGEPDTFAPELSGETPAAPADSLDPTLDPNAPLDPTLDPNASLDPTLDPNASLDPTLDPNAPLDGTTGLDPTLDPNVPSSTLEPSFDPLAPPTPEPTTSLDPTLDPNAPLDPTLDPDASLTPSLEPVDTTTSLPVPEPAPALPQPEPVAIPEPTIPDDSLDLTVPEPSSDLDPSLTVTDEDELILSPETLEAGEDELLLD